MATKGGYSSKGGSKAGSKSGSKSSSKASKGGSKKKPPQGQIMLGGAKPAKPAKPKAGGSKPSMKPKK